MIAQRLLTNHLAHEECEAIAIIQRHLSAPEWADIEGKHFQRRPAPASLHVLVPWFLEEVPEQEVTRVVDTVGVPVAVIWRLTRRSFRRAEHRAFRYARD